MKSLLFKLSFFTNVIFFLCLFLFSYQQAHAVYYACNQPNEQCTGGTWEDTCHAPYDLGRPGLCGYTWGTRFQEGTCRDMVTGTNKGTCLLGSEKCCADPNDPTCSNCRTTCDASCTAAGYTSSGACTGFAKCTGGAGTRNADGTMPCGYCQTPPLYECGATRGTYCSTRANECYPGASLCTDDPNACNTFCLTPPTATPTTSPPPSTCESRYGTGYGSCANCAADRASGGTCDDKGDGCCKSTPGGGTCTDKYGPGYGSCADCEWNRTNGGTCDNKGDGCCKTTPPTSYCPSGNLKPECTDNDSCIGKGTGVPWCDGGCCRFTPDERVTSNAFFCDQFTVTREDGTTVKGIERRLSYDPTSSTYKPINILTVRPGELVRFNADGFANGEEWKFNNWVTFNFGNNTQCGENYEPIPDEENIEGGRYKSRSVEWCDGNVQKKAAGDYRGMEEPNGMYNQGELCYRGWGQDVNILEDGGRCLCPMTSLGEPDTGVRDPDDNLVSTCKNMVRDRKTNMRYSTPGIYYVTATADAGYGVVGDVDNYPLDENCVIKINVQATGEVRGRQQVINADGTRRFIYTPRKLTLSPNDSDPAGPITADPFYFYKTPVGKHEVTIENIPNYDTYYTLCVPGIYTCHSVPVDQMTKGNKAMVDVKQDQFHSLWFHYVPNGKGTVQGYKVVEPGAKKIEPDPYRPQPVRMDNTVPSQNRDQVVNQFAQPYFFYDITAGSHTFGVPALPDWEIGYSLCIVPIINCHEGATADIKWGFRSVPINVAALTTYDLWWHYRPDSAAKYTISGDIFLDTDKDGAYDTGEPPYPGSGMTVSVGGGTPVALSGSTFTVPNLPANVTAQGVVLDTGTTGVSVTTGATQVLLPCTTPAASILPTGRAGGCSSGDVVGLKIGVAASPWTQGYVLDMRPGYKYNVPAGKYSAEPYLATPPDLSTIGVIFGKPQSPSFLDFSPGASSRNGWVVSSDYKARNNTSYNELLKLARRSGKTITKLCSGNPNDCTVDVSTLQSGIYLRDEGGASSTLYIDAPNTTTADISGNKSITILNLGNVQFRESLAVEADSFFLVSTSNNLSVKPSVTGVSGFLNAGGTATIQGIGDCSVGTDEALTIEGSLVARTVAVNRDKCDQNNSSPSLILFPRVDFILNYPPELSDQSTILRELAP